MEGLPPHSQMVLHGETQEPWRDRDWRGNRGHKSHRKSVAEAGLESRAPDRGLQHQRGHVPQQTGIVPPSVLRADIAR